MAQTLIWLNEDGLNPDHPMFRDYPDAPRIYIFDLPYLQQWKISKHRVQFIYESLLDIPQIQIYKGETLSILGQLIAESAINQIATTETPNHLIKAWQNEVQKLVPLVTYPEIYPVEDKTSPRRFSRYWRKHADVWLMK